MKTVRITSRMLQQRMILILAPLALLFTNASPVSADPFINPPETAWNPPWTPPQRPVYPYYQRDIYWNFNVNPVGGPSPSGAPGAVYEGVLDPVLMSSDYVAFSGSFAYYPTITVSSGTYTDAIGIVNTGDTVLSGDADFHVDNTPPTNKLKLIWIEDEGASLNSTGAWTVLANSNEYSPVTEMSSQISPSLYLEDFGFEVYPNPSSEDLVETFDVQPGGFDLLTSVHVATDCPEPAGLGLLGLGAIGLMLRRRRAV